MNEKEAPAKLDTLKSKECGHRLWIHAILLFFTD
jgi:hypothetical protein